MSRRTPNIGMHIPLIEKLIQLSEILGVSLDYLVTGNKPTAKEVIRYDDSRAKRAVLVGEDSIITA